MEIFNGECIHKYINRINLIVENELLEKVKQAGIRDFFRETFCRTFFTSMHGVILIVTVIQEKSL